jgi:hypothetical protein
MVWDPAIPATNADLLSAPVRENFAALETSVMGALGALATQQVLLRAPGPAIGGVAVGSDGHVLTLASGAPVWQAAPTGGGAVGEWNWSTTITSPATGTQMRLNAAHPYTAATTLWVRYQTVNGTDARTALLLTKPGQTLHIQDKNDSTLYVRLTVTAVPTDDTANGQVVLPIAWISNGNAMVNNQNVLMIIGAAQSAATIIDAKGDLIVGTAPDTATRLSVGTDGQVLMAEAAQATGVKWAAPLSGMTQGSVLFAGSGGVLAQDNTNFFFDDTNNNLRLFGGGVGTSGQGVLALGPGMIPSTSPVDTVQLFTYDLGTEAGSKAFGIRDERGGFFEYGSFANAGIGTQFAIYNVTNTTKVYTAVANTYAGIGTSTNQAFVLWAFDQSIVSINTDRTVAVHFNVLGTSRALALGAIDSGGAGYRMLRVAN